MRIKQIIFFLLLTACLPLNSFAALPFVTDDAATQKKNQLALETFAERWIEPQSQQAEKSSNLLYSYFISASYGLMQNLELTMAGNAGYDTREHSASFMNPIVQIKTKLYESKNPYIPSFALDLGYANRNGKGEYFDPAQNFYSIVAATNKFFDDKFITHVNFGKKASYDIAGHGNVYRDHFGLACEIMLAQKISTVLESYNGAPNSPRDSPNFFHSYQVGIKYIKSANASFYTIYGTQPTFVGYSSSNQMMYRNTSWIQIGARLIFDNIID